MFRYSVLLVSLLLLATAAPVSHAQEVASHARIVRISYVEGGVQLSDKTATVNSPITEGAVLSTGPDGIAEVEFEDSSAIRLASETQITFAQLARLSSGEVLTRVDLDEGEAEFLVPASSAGGFAVNVRSKNILFREPGRFRILSTKSSPLELAVWKGEAVVSDRETGRQVQVQKKETFTLNPDDPSQYDLQATVLADDLDQWSDQRDQSLRTALSSTYTSPYTPPYYSAPYVSSYSLPQPFLYGANDFNCSGATTFGPLWGLQPFWFSGPGNCFSSGFFFPPFFFTQPFFNSPGFVVVQPIIHPRHPPIIRPPTPPVVARGETAAEPVKPRGRPVGEPVKPGRVFNQDTVQSPKAVVGASGEALKPGGNGQSAQTPADLRPMGPVVAPGQRSGNFGSAASGSTPAPVRGTAPTPTVAPSHAVRPAPPSPPARSVSPPPSSSRGFSGGSMPRSSPPMRSGPSRGH